MAVFTPLTHQEIDACLTEVYPQDTFGGLVTAEGICAGVENSNFLLHTRKGRFILTLFEGRTNPADLPYFMAVMQHFAEHGIICPQPVATLAGGYLFTIKQRQAVVVSFLEGNAIEPPTVASCATMGGYLARLHQVGAHCPQRRENPMNITGCQQLLVRIDRDKADSWRPGVIMAIEQALAAAAQQWPGWAATLPGGTVHLDAFPDNIFFQDTSHVSGVIDWYFTADAPFVYDLAIVLLAWGFAADNTVDQDRTQALLQAYQRERRLSQAEIDALPLMQQIAAIRFLITRLYDWLLPVDSMVIIQRKDPLEYWQKWQVLQRCGSISGT